MNRSIFLIAALVVLGVGAVLFWPDPEPEPTVADKLEEARENLAEAAEIARENVEDKVNEITEDVTEGANAALEDASRTADALAALVDQQVAEVSTLRERVVAELRPGGVLHREGYDSQNAADFLSDLGMTPENATRFAEQLQLLYDSPMDTDRLLEALQQKMSQ